MSFGGRGELSSNIGEWGLSWHKHSKEFFLDLGGFGNIVPMDSPVRIGIDYRYDGFVALGCVIKGETPHFEFISRSTINAIMHLSFTYKKPIGNGIITCFNKKQALDRSNKNNNKGRESVKAMLALLKI